MIIKALVVLALFLSPVASLAQTATPTNTPTHTPTSTPTPGGESGFMGWLNACASPPCELPIRIAARKGHKTAVVAITGTATVQLKCKSRSDINCPEIQIGSNFTASGIVEFNTWCEEVVAVISAYTSGSVAAWVTSDPSM